MNRRRFLLSAVVTGASFGVAGRLGSSDGASQSSSALSAVDPPPAGNDGMPVQLGRGFRIENDGHLEPLAVPWRRREEADFVVLDMSNHVVVDTHRTGVSLDDLRAHGPVTVAAIEGSDVSPSIVTLYIASNGEIGAKDHDRTPGWVTAHLTAARSGGELQGLALGDSAGPMGI